MGLEDVMKASRERIEAVLGPVERANELVAWLPKTDFYRAPASAHHHLCVPGGLALHSLHVYDRLVRKTSDWGLRTTLETAAVVALLHDLCKISTYDLTEHGGYVRREKFVYGHGEKSVWIAERRMRLTPEEALAIRWHMGAYEGERAWNDLSKVYSSVPLAFALHVADMEATFLDDVRGVPQ